jgi:uncharacterized membrane protein YuzA (DUF378 family)
MSIGKEAQKVGQVVESFGQAAEQITGSAGKIFKAVVYVVLGLAAVSAVIYGVVHFWR